MVKRVPAERTKTNADLKGERDATDRKLVRRRKSVAAEADAVVQRARHRADVVLEKARDVADRETPGATEPAVEAAREVEDASLDDERKIADETLRREREATTRALHDLLPLERDKTDRSLLTERARSDEALAVRDDFLGIVSHDIRSLLGGVVMSSALIAARVAGRADSEVVLAETQRIQRYAARMNRLVGDLLDVGSMEAGRLRVTPARGDLAALIDEAFDTYQGVATEAGVSLKVTKKGAPLLAEFDHDRMLQVLSNLVGNAIKFTPRGGRINVHGEPGDGTIEICVTDTGPGIAPELREAVFERFWQVGRHDRRGLGLGLYISRGIVESHGGRIWTEGAPDGGSRFHLSLPAAEAEPAGEGA